MRRVDDENFLKESRRNFERRLTWMVGKGEIGSDRGHGVSWADVTLRSGWTKNWAMWGTLETGLQ